MAASVDMSGRRWSRRLAIFGTVAAFVVFAVLLGYGLYQASVHGDVEHSELEVTTSAVQLALVWLAAWLLGLVAFGLSSLPRASALLMCVAAALGFCGIAVTGGVQVLTRVDSDPWHSSPTGFTGSWLVLLWLAAAVPWVASAAATLLTSSNHRSSSGKGTQ